MSGDQQNIPPLTGGNYIIKIVPTSTGGQQFTLQQQAPQQFTVQQQTAPPFPAGGSPALVYRHQQTEQANTAEITCLVRQVMSEIAELEKSMGIVRLPDVPSETELLLEADLARNASTPPLTDSEEADQGQQSAELSMSALDPSVNALVQKALKLIKKSETPYAMPIIKPPMPFSQVKSLAELEELEAKAADKAFIMSVIKAVGYLEGGGRTACLQLAEKFFDRLFIAQCCWAGKTSNKIPIKNYKNTINLLYRTARYSDLKLTYWEAADVIYQVVKNWKPEGNRRRKATMRRKKRMYSENENNDPDVSVDVSMISEESASESEPDEQVEPWW
ncbi:uncharacterized protein LOC118458471 [Anopheles albimanus]|uniref:DUF4806 domain-containing protein n=1 Tax=Anopheles albimanus TaxID=7167 RepID=A0A182FL09_ANOAL|nr:uncharacterized protein LOC118458471 [Anopheles albimanus]